jgi:hypothetical protein
MLGLASARISRRALLLRRGRHTGLQEQAAAAALFHGGAEVEFGARAAAGAAAVAAPQHGQVAGLIRAWG